MRRKTRGLLSALLGVVLALGVVVGFAPRMALAEGAVYNPASEYTGYDTLNTDDTTVKIDGVKYDNADVEWYVIGYDGDAETVTLLSKQALGRI